MAIIINNVKKNGVIEDELLEGKVVVSATETVYGFVAKTIYKDAFEKIYKLKSRNKSKPLAVFIGDSKDITRYGKISKLQRGKVKKLLDKGTTIIVTINEEFKSIFNGLDTVAFRVPQCELKSIIKRVGPCWATSVNMSGDTEMSTTKEIDRKFGEDIGFIYDCIKPSGTPSTIIDYTGFKKKVVRK